MLLTVIAIGLVLSSSLQPDPFLQQAELAFGFGAFALAWMLPQPPAPAKDKKSKKDKGE
ncbi:MAG: hypothetical protein V9E83_13140 [Baekduia sp.]